MVARETLPAQTLEMLKPKGRSVKAEENYGLRVKHFYGEVGRDFAERLRIGRLTSYEMEDFRGRVDEHFFHAFEATYPVSKSITVQSAYLNAQAVAIGVVKDCVLKAFPDYEDDMFRNEVALQSPSPADLYYYMVLNEPEQPAFEVRRHFVLLNSGADLDARSGNGKLALDLSRLNRFFDDNLFSSRKGSQNLVYAFHNCETNEVQKVLVEKPENSPEGAVLRTHTLTLREVEDIGLVQTRIRQKDLVSAVEKMMSKAAVSDGVLHPESVKDYMGFTLIAVGENADTPSKVDLLVSRVEEILNTNPGVKESVRDDEPDGDRGQAIESFRRLLVYTDEQVPFEIIFFGDKDYLNTVHEIGRRNPETGFYTGRAHELYELRRTYPIMPFILPKEIYTGLDPQAVLLKRMQEVAQKKNQKVNVV